MIISLWGAFCQRDFCPVPVSSPLSMIFYINKTDCINVTEILLKLTLNNITLTIALQQDFSYITVVGFLSRGNRRMQKKPQTCCK
jgi:aspartokinase